MCPLCHIEKESVCHVLYCPHPAIQHIRRSYIQQMDESLKRMNTQPQLQRFLMNTIKSVVTDAPIEEPPVTSALDSVAIYQIYQAQCNIGWNNFFLRYLTLIQNMQEDYLRRERNHTPWLSARQWSKSLTNLLIYYRTIWRHRCEILVLGRNETMEVRKRVAAKEQCQTLRKKWWLLLPTDQYLVHRDDNCSYVLL